MGDQVNYIDQQAGAELGQAWHKLGLDLTLIFCRFGFSRFGFEELVGMIEFCRVNCKDLGI